MSVMNLWKSFESKLREPVMAMEQEESVKTHQAMAATLNTATKIVNEYRDRERRKFSAYIILCGHL